MSLSPGATSRVIISRSEDHRHQRGVLNLGTRPDAPKLYLFQLLAGILESVNLSLSTV